MKCLAGWIHISVAFVLWMINTILWQMLVIFGHPAMGVICFLIFVSTTVLNLSLGLRYLLEYYEQN